MVELFKHKERILAATKLSEAEVLECLVELLSRISFIDEGSIPIGVWMEGRRLCADVDPKDTPFVALSLHLGGRLWSKDAQLKAGLQAKGFDQFFEP
jgi:predicted nucleic acid-binding protein